MLEALDFTIGISLDKRLQLPVNLTVWLRLPRDYAHAHLEAQGYFII